MNVGKTRSVYLIWFGIFLVWSIYRAWFKLPEAIDELVVKPLIFVLPVIWWVKYREKRKLESIGITGRNFFQEIYIGVGIGVLFALEGLVANYFKYGTWSFAPLAALSSVGLMPFLLYSLFTSVSEEILGRGFVYGRLQEGAKDQLKPAIVASFLFLLLHIPIIFTRLNLVGVSLVVYIVSIFLLGVTNSYLYSYRKSLVVSILVHIFWNATVALYL
ncbi:CPBP family intramembrane metalloprotease [Candidatus Gottesmanbacteria bacterium]|nr:CPBP family intramembrane metalloprotease [Candidatus Gottesmanbacteria bacterium]